LGRLTGGVGDGGGLSWWRREVLSAAWERKGVGGDSGSPGTRGGRAVICKDVVAGELELGRGRDGEDVWEVSSDGVSLFSQQGWPFIGRSSGHRG
jgi:hypothetical protein